MQRLFRQEPSIEQVWLYGSRAKGTFQPGSDIDLALIGDTISRHAVSQIHAVLEEESPIPFFFDVVHWDTIANEKLKHEIQRTAQLLYQRSH